MIIKPEGVHKADCHYGYIQDPLKVRADILFLYLNAPIRDGAVPST